MFRLAIALIAAAVAMAACAPSLTAAPAEPTYALTVLDVRGADLFASVADHGLSAADCTRAAAARPMAVCEREA